MKLTSKLKRSKPIAPDFTFADAAARVRAHESHFVGGTYRYRKQWLAPEELRGRQVSLVFEGVYRNSRV